MTHFQLSAIRVFTVVGIGIVVTSILVGPPAENLVLQPKVVELRIPISKTAVRRELIGNQNRQEKTKKKQKKTATLRSKKPDFSKQENRTKSIYFSDVLKEGIAGPLPKLGSSKLSTSKLASSKVPNSSNNNSENNSTNSNGESPQTGGPFDTLVSAETIENQVKRTVNELGKIITTPRKFRTDYNKAHIAYSKLSVLFAINEVYSADVRWHSQAAKLRSSLSKTAASCRVGTPQAYQAAKLMLEDMRTVLNGSKPSLPEAKEKITEWDTVVDRGPLMTWLETLHQENLRPHASSVSAMKKNQEEVKESAELVASIAKILKLPEMEGYDDEDYIPHADAMQKASQEVLTGLKVNDFKAAIGGINGIEKSCASCHEDYR